MKNQSVYNYIGYCMLFFAMSEKWCMCNLLKEMNRMRLKHISLKGITKENLHVLIRLFNKIMNDPIEFRIKKKRDKNGCLFTMNVREDQLSLLKSFCVKSTYGHMFMSRLLLCDNKLEKMIPMDDKEWVDDYSFLTLDTLVYHKVLDDNVLTTEAIYRMGRTCLHWKLEKDERYCYFETTIKELLLCARKKPTYLVKNGTILVYCDIKVNENIKLFMSNKVIDTIEQNGKIL